MDIRTENSRLTYFIITILSSINEKVKGIQILLDNMCLFLYVSLTIQKVW